MKENWIYAELHTGLFLGSDKGGKNCGTKLKVREMTGLSLTYDTEVRELTVKLPGFYTAKIPRENIAFWWPDLKAGTPAQKAQADKTHEVTLPSPPAAAPQANEKRGPGRPPAKVKVEAQVGGPQHRVFQGPGHGDTGVSLNLPK